MNDPVLQGIGVVNATPLHDDGTLNEDVYVEHVDWLVNNGVGFIQPHAATGQGALSTEEEYERLLRLTVETVDGRVPVTAYSGRASTEDAVTATKLAQELGADAAFVIQPWYSKPDEVGLFEHFTRIADSVTIPIAIYNNPQRAGISMSVDLISRLVESHENIIGLKQTNLGDVVDSFTALRGAGSVSPYGDAEILWGLSMGATWSISYTANVIPREWASVYEAWIAGDIERARATYYRYMPLVRATHLEPIPGPIKYMLNQMGWDFGPCRLPIHDVGKQTAETIDLLLADLGLVG